MAILDLRRDLAFFTRGLTDEEALTGTVDDLQTLITSHPEQSAFVDYDSFSDAVGGYWHTSSNSRVLRRARDFFEKVIGVYQIGNDVIYDMKANEKVEGRDFQIHYLNSPHDLYQAYASGSIDDAALLGGRYFTSIAGQVPETMPVSTRQELGDFLASRVSSTDFFYEMDEFESLRQSEATDSLDFASTVKCFNSVVYSSDGKQVEYFLLVEEVLEATRLYYSEDLSWISPADRKEIILSSFKPNIVKGKTAKFNQYIDSDNYEYQRQLADDYLVERQRIEKVDNDLAEYDTGESQVVLDMMETGNIDQMVDWISMMIMIESQGDPNCEVTFKSRDETGKEKYRRTIGLMQVDEENFLQYGPAEYNGKNGKDPSINIKTGINYLLNYCFRAGINPEKSITHAIGIYNGGVRKIEYEGKIKYTVTETSKKYICSFLIYQRLLEQMDAD